MTGPMIIGMLSIVAFNLADAYFVGQLGKAQLAAMGYTFPVVIFLGTIARGIGMGASSVLSRAIGQGDSQRVRRLTTDSLILGVLVGAVIAAIGQLTIDPLFSLLGAGPGTLAMIRQYMVIWYPGAVFLTVPMVGNQAIRASGDTFWPSVVMMVSAGLNIVLDPLLIFGWGPVPAMGLQGAAIATVFARFGTLVASLALLHFKKRMLARPTLDLREMLISWKAVLAIGVPAGATQTLFPISRLALTSFIAQFSVDRKAAVAAFGTGTRIEALAMLVLWALATVLLPVIGQNLGAGLTERIRRASRLASWFAMFWGLVCWGLFILLAEPIARAFSDDKQVVRYLVRYLWIVPACFSLRGVFIVNNAALNGLHRPFTAGAMNVVRMVGLIIPLGYIGARWWGPDGLLVALAGANLLAGAVSWGWTAAVERRLQREGVGHWSLSTAPAPAEGL